MRIKQLYIYPVKSLRGYPLPRATLTRFGLAHDRNYMLVRCHLQNDGTKTYESLYVGRVDALCLFSAALLPDNETIRVTYNTPISTEKDVDIGQNPYIDFPATPEFKDLDKLDLNIHQSHCLGYDIGPLYQRFFSKHLGFDTKLVYIGDSTRQVLGNVAPDKTFITEDSESKSFPAGPQTWFVFGLLSWVVGYLLGWNFLKGGSDKEGGEYKIRFADCAPVLVTSVASLAALEKDGEEKVELDMTKLRPNIVLEASESEELTPFEEDYWAELLIGDNTDNEKKKKIVLTANCGRCKSLNVDYKTGRQLPVKQQMLKRLADMKRRVDSGHGYSPVFGRYGFIDESGLGEEVRVGEGVVVGRRNEERTVFYWPGLSAGTRPKK